MRTDLAKTVDGAEQAGLPTDVLVDKIREGLAKKVPAHLILEVVRTLASDLASARSVAVSLMSTAAPQAPFLRALVDAMVAGLALPTLASEVDRRVAPTFSAAEGTLDQALQHTHRDTPSAVFDWGLHRDPGLHNGKLAGAR